MSDLVELLATAIYDISESGFQNQDFKRQLAEYEKAQKQARALIALVRKETLEEAAKLMEERTARSRTIYALQNGERNNVAPCEHAAAIRKLWEE